MKIRNESGFAIFFVLMFFLTAAFGLTSLGQLGGTNMRNARHHLESVQSFYLSESALEEAKALLKLEESFLDGTPMGQSGDFAMGDGEYFYDIDDAPDGNPFHRLVTGVAAVPDTANPVATRAIEIVVHKPDDLPLNFWDYAIYSAGDVRGNGNSYNVNGDVIAGDDIEYSQDHFNDGETEDPSVSPLANLNYDSLKAIAMSQVYDGHDNYYPESEIGVTPFPTDFYYIDPDPITGTPGVPNVVFIEGNLTLNGTWGNIGGFVIVVGDILTNPDAEGDTTINGNGTIDGVVYTLGEMTVNGGGGGINVNGGVFAADEVTLNGNTTVTYNQEYMDAIEDLDLPTGLTVLSWNEISSPL